MAYLSVFYNYSVSKFFVVTDFGINGWHSRLIRRGIDTSCSIDRFCEDHPELAAEVQRRVRRHK